jgi:REP element-mobilizing transposase RayT
VKLTLAGITDPGYNNNCAQTFAPARTRLDRLADLFRHNVHLQTALDSRLKESCKDSADEWRDAHDRHGWAIGRYIIVPDHVHFFCRAELNAKTLPTFIQAWKQWTSKRMARELKFSGNVWQEGFFDHVLRSSDSYGQKWNYVRENPVQAGIVRSPRGLAMAGRN